MSGTSTTRTDEQRRFARAFAAGAAIATIAFAWMITDGTFDFFRRMPFGADFYDAAGAQSPRRHLRHAGLGRAARGLPVPRAPRHVLRAVPVAAASPHRSTHALTRRPYRPDRDARGVRGGDDRGGTSPVAGPPSRSGHGCVVRWRRRGPPRRRPSWSASDPASMFLGSAPLVYHEAIIWSVAFSLAAFSALLAWIEQPRDALLLLAGVFTLLLVAQPTGGGARTRRCCSGSCSWSHSCGGWRPVERLQRHVGLDLHGVRRSDDRVDHGRTRRAAHRLRDRQHHQVRLRRSAFPTAGRSPVRSCPSDPPPSRPTADHCSTSRRWPPTCGRTCGPMRSGSTRRSRGSRSRPHDRW